MILCHISFPVQEDILAGLEFGDLNITSEDDDILDEAAGHIQENLEDELVQEALSKVCCPDKFLEYCITFSSPPPNLFLKGLDLRQYSRQIETELRRVEVHSIQDCILIT